MRTIIKNTVFLIALAIFQPVAQATHIVGGELTYRCLGNHWYEFYLTVRRDCQLGEEPFDPKPALSIFNGENQFLVQRGKNGYVPLTLLSIREVKDTLLQGCLSQLNPVCVEEARYVGRVYLPPTEKSGYILAYQRCCRNRTITNIQSPLETGTTYFVHIPGHALNLCNSSPVFKSWAPLYLCVNQPFSFDHSAFDADGDSLVYKLCTPYQGLDRQKPQDLRAERPPYKPILWKPPYSEQDMMGGVPLTIDSLTGRMTATPATLGQFLIGVCVEEYRNGVLIGRYHRDFEFNVRPCAEMPEAYFEPPDTCDGLEVTFQNKTTNAKSYRWFFDADGDTTLQSTEESPTFRYDSAGTYRVLLIADNNGCIDTFSRVITVFDVQFHIEFSYQLFCDSLPAVLLLYDQSTASQGITKRAWIIDDHGIIHHAEGDTVRVVLSKGQWISLSLQLTDSLGCQSDTTARIYLPTIDVELASDTFVLCSPDTVTVFSQSRPHYRYSWSPDSCFFYDSATHTLKLLPCGSGTYGITVTNDTCTWSDSITVVYDPIPEFEIVGPDTTCDESVTLYVQPASDDITYVWYGDTLRSRLLGVGDSMTILSTSGTVTIMVVAQSRGMCEVIDTHQITFFKLQRDFPDILEGCNNEMLCLNPAGDTMLDYQWSPAHCLDNPNAPNPCVTCPDTVKFYVTVTKGDYPGCRHVDSIQVNRYGGFPFSGGDTICEFRRYCIVLPFVNGDTIIWTVGDTTYMSGDSLCYGPDSMENIFICRSHVVDSFGCEYDHTFTIYYLPPLYTIAAPSALCYGSDCEITITNYSKKFPRCFDLPDTSIVLGPQEQYVFCPDIDWTTGAMSFWIHAYWGWGSCRPPLCMRNHQITIRLGGYGTDTISVEATANPKVTFVGDTVQLHVVPSGYTYRWTPGKYLDDPRSQSPKASMDSAGLYIFTVHVSDHAGCEVGYDTVHVRVRPLNCIDNVFVPTAFSPNDDGINDVLYVRSFVIESLEFSIYDRWGKRIFTTNDINRGWDGTINGVPAQPDVYNYLLKYRCVTGEDYSRTGNVTLLR